MAAIGFLHTSPAHVATFRALLDDVAPDVDGAHVVDADLLTQAQLDGVDDALRERLRRRLAELAAQPVDIVLCTCSTLGGDAEALATRVHVPVLRVDRPMAEAAVASGGRVAVVAAVASTLTPTRRLLEDSAAAAGTATAVVLAPCLDAWGLFEAVTRTATRAASPSTCRPWPARARPTSSCWRRPAWRPRAPSCLTSPYPC